MTNIISYEYYSELCNRLAGYLVTNNKEYKKRETYTTSAIYEMWKINFITKTLGEIEATAEKNYKANNFAGDTWVTEYVECIFYDNDDLTFMPKTVTGRDGKIWTIKQLCGLCEYVSYKEAVLGIREKAIPTFNGINNDLKTFPDNEDVEDETTLKMRAYKNKKDINELDVSKYINFEPECVDNCSVETIVFGSNIVYIHENAFKDCTNLKVLDCRNVVNVGYIDDNAFYNVSEDIEIWVDKTKNFSDLVGLKATYTETDGSLDTLTIPVVKMKG